MQISGLSIKMNMLKKVYLLTFLMLITFLSLNFRFEAVDGLKFLVCTSAYRLISL